MPIIKIIVCLQSVSGKGNEYNKHFFHLSEVQLLPVFDSSAVQLDFNEGKTCNSAIPQFSTLRYNNYFGKNKKNKSSPFP